MWYLVCVWESACRHPGLPTCIFVLHAALSCHRQPALAGRARGAYTNGDSQLQVVLTRPPIKAAPRTSSTACPSVICCLRQGKRGLPASQVGSPGWASRPRRCGKRSHSPTFPIGVAKTISASSLGPRLGPLCPAPTHEPSYYVNWALDRVDRGISATTPAIIRAVEPMPDPRCPGHPRQGPGGEQGSVPCFLPLFPHMRRDGADENNKRKARGGAVHPPASKVARQSLRPSGFCSTLDAPRSSLLSL